MSHAHRRLMDLLAGWERYVASCEESSDGTDTTPKRDYEREGEEIGALYQAVGRHEELTGAECRDVLLDILHIITEGVRRSTEDQKDR